MKDYNERRRSRATSDRRFTLCAYTFTRRSEVPLGVLTSFTQATSGANGEGPDEPRVVDAFVGTFMQCVEPTCIVTETGEVASTGDAWVQITTIGDDLGPIGLETLADVVQGLVEGTTEGPTGEASASSDASPTPLLGTPSMDGSPSPEVASTISTPVEPVTSSTPS